MTINDYIRIVRRRGWILVASVLVAATLAFGVSYLQEDMYRATVQVSTVPARADMGLGLTAKDLMRNFVTNMQTPEMARLAIERAQLDQNPFDFLSNVTVNEDSSTFIISVEARARDPQTAVEMALALSDEFVEERTTYYASQDKRDRIEVKIVSREIGGSKFQPNPLTNAVAGGVLGLLLGVAVVFLLTWMEADRLRTRASVERALGISVLGAIPAVDKPRATPQRTPRRSRIGAPEAA